MKLRVGARWRAGDSDLDSRLLPLLRNLSREGSLSRAVAVMRLSYRHAWGLLGKAERTLGEKLVLMQRGRGATLSPFGARLIEADDAAALLLARDMAGAIEALNRPAALSRKTAPARRLLVHASHDLALADLRDWSAAAGKVELDLHFRGSLDCLASLARRECDLAGFHVPEPASNAALAPYRPWLRNRGLRLIRFVTRRQGLIVPRGNPRQLVTLADLAEKGARFVNRQPESGTRLCFDRLLAESRLRPAQIKGYRVEEFTHAAVAATVASGMADAGFGIEAAARQAGLDFVPLADERYYLAARAQTLARPEARALLEMMKEPAFLRRLAALPGYEGAGIGEPVSVGDALPPSR